VSKKNKLQRFAENETFANMFQVGYNELMEGFDNRGNWNKKFFKNN